MSTNTTDDTQQQQAPKCPALFPYSAPSWAAIPTEDSPYRLEIIKDGRIVENIELHNLQHKSFLSFGRFDPCDLRLEHPTVSRYHCILQYGQLNTAETPHWYIYDMGSTHGTSLNKQPLKKHCYTELRSGFVFKVAGSSRVFAFCGSKEAEDAEEERRTHAWREAIIQGPTAPVEILLAAAAATEGPNNTAADIDDNTDESNKEEGERFYDKDPILWLEKYFEREGLQLHFQYAKAPGDGSGGGIIDLDSDKSKKRKKESVCSDWSCSIELAEDTAVQGGPIITASAFTRQLAKSHCALLACERLHASGLLRTSSIWNKRGAYRDNDFYDSDDDDYLDRTGQIEAKRLKRKGRLEDTQGLSGSKTYDMLRADLADAENKLIIVRSELSKLPASTSTNFTARMAISQMRSKEKTLVRECEELKKLVEVVKPVDLDRLFPVAVENSVSSSPPVTSQNVESGVSAEEESMETPKQSPPPPLLPQSEEATPPATRRKKPSAQPTLQFLAPKYGIITREEARLKRPMLLKRRVQGDEDEGEEQQHRHPDDYADISSTQRDDYATWLPPEDQRGDGTTKLNKKFAGRY